MTLFGSRIYGGVGQLGASAKAAVVPWYLAGGVASANCIAAYQPKGAADYAASKINLANPGTYDATDDTVYPDWDAVNGWKYRADNNNLQTGITPGNQTWTIIARYAGFNAAKAEAPFGTLNSGASLGMTHRPTATTALAGWASGQYSVAATSSIAGVIAIAGVDVYWNGTYKASASPVAGTFSYPLSLCAIYYAGNKAYWFIKSMTVQAISIYNALLTAPQIAAISTRAAAL